MKITIVGMGHVGSTVAFSLMQQGLADDIVLHTRRAQVAHGHALDLQHSLAFFDHPCRVAVAEEAKDTAGSDIIIWAASTPWKDTYTSRMDLAVPNKAILSALLPGLVRHSPDALLLLLSNPLDHMTQLAWQLSGLPRSRVLGVGTLIDSARLRRHLSEREDVHPSDIRAYVLGEHSDQQVHLFSSIRLGGVPLDTSSYQAEIAEKTSRGGNVIMKNKGFSNFAISLAAAYVVRSIVEDASRTLPISTPLEGWMGLSGVSLSVPAVVGRAGVKRLLEPALSPEELAGLKKSADEQLAFLEQLR